MGTMHKISPRILSSEWGKMKPLLAVLLFVALVGHAQGAMKCPPTTPDGLGPFYDPDAPERSVLGTGYVLTGTVRSSVDCGIIPEARIEVWQAGPDREYADAYRATLVADTHGQYRLQTYRPPSYSHRPPHIHIRVEAPGYATLITQHYLEKDARGENPRCADDALHHGREKEKADRGAPKGLKIPAVPAKEDEHFSPGNVNTSDGRKWPT